MTSLTDTRIQELLDFDDPTGVLSFYVGQTPDRAADPQPTAPLEFRSRIEEVVDALREQDPRSADIMAAKVNEIRADLDRFLDPTAPGRGRALFVGVDSDRRVEVSVQVPFPNRVAYHPSPYIRPLLAAMDEGRPAGILNVTNERTRLLAWQLGEATELETHTFEVEDDVIARQKAGPSAGNVAHPGQGRVDRDAFDHRLDENRQRFIKDHLNTVVNVAADHGWDRIVVAGAPKLRDETAKQLRDQINNDVLVLVANESYDDATPDTIAQQVAPQLTIAHREREMTLVNTAINQALSGNTGAVGLREVCESLNEGRVQHLLFRSDLTVRGYRSDEGTLHPYVEGAVAESDQTALHPEPLFVERMIEKARSTSAKVTPVDDEAAEPLDAHEGVAAILRW